MSALIVHLQGRPRIQSGAPWLINGTALLLLAAMVLACASAAAAEAAPLWDGQESIAEYAKRIGVPPTKSVDLGGDVTMEFVLVPAGRFRLGTPEPSEPDWAASQWRIDKWKIVFFAGICLLIVLLFTVLYKLVFQRKRPQLSLIRFIGVTVAVAVILMGGVRMEESRKDLDAAREAYLSAKYNMKMVPLARAKEENTNIARPFYLSKYELTNAQHDQLVLLQALSHKVNPRGSRLAKEPHQPFVGDLSELLTENAWEVLGTATKAKARIPTEIEWEFACRAGAEYACAGQADTKTLGRYAWWAENSGGRPHPVGEKEPNGLGLYDMQGNLMEITANCPDAYNLTDEDLGAVPYRVISGGPYVMRGGSYKSFEEGCMPAARALPSEIGTDLVPYNFEEFGYRILLEIDGFAEPASSGNVAKISR